MRRVSINEEIEKTYVTIATTAVVIEYEFDTFEEALEALPNLNELQQD